MFKLNERISKDIVHATKFVHVGEIQVSGAHYYVKPDQDLKEVIGYYLARMFDLSCAKYFSVRVKNKNYSVSLDLKYKKDFNLASSFSVNGLAWPEILDMFQKVSILNESLKKDMIRMYLYDILFMNDDRHDENWGLFVQKQQRIILLDQGNIFSFGRKPMICFDPLVYVNKNVDEAMGEDFLLFYDSLFEEEKRMVEQYLKKAIPSQIKNVFWKIEEQYGWTIDPLFLSVYEDHYQKIMTLFNEKRCSYGR